MTNDEIPEWVRDFPGGTGIYLSGVRAGMEHAAKICEKMDTWHHEYINGPLRCAAVIRAAANVSPPVSK